MWVIQSVVVMADSMAAKKVALKAVRTVDY